MKKLLAVVLGAAMVLSLGACGKKAEPVDPKAVYEEAIKKNGELASMDMESTSTMTMKQGEETLEMSTDVKAKMDGINTDKMIYYAETTSNVAGQASDAVTFYQDGYCYVESQGQKMKYAIALEDMMEQVRTAAESGNVELEYMKDLAVKQEGDNQILTFTVDPEKMDSYVQEVMGAMTGSLEGLEGLTMKINSASGQYTINKDGYYTDMQMTMDYDMTMEGETLNTVMDTTAKINNPGQAVTIELPSTDGYEEIDLSATQS